MSKDNLARDKDGKPIFDRRGFQLYVHYDPFTGEETLSRHRSIFETVDPVPFAPQVETNRPTIRQRIENLLNRGVDPLSHYVNMRADDGYDMEVPDDPEAPLTASEQNYVDAIAASLAEQAPLPDEGLPRPEAPPPTASPAASPQAPNPAPAGVSSPPQARPVPT